jgi:hypothetical protein
LRDYIGQEIEGSKQLDVDFNFPKIQFMCRWVDHIRRYDSLQQYSAVRHKQAGYTNLNDGWNDSNQNLNYLPQVISCQCRILYFEMRELNLQALAQRRENSAAASNVLPSGADLAAPLGSQSSAKPEFMGPLNSHDGKHPNAMIKNLRALLNNTQDATHRVAIYGGTWVLIKDKSHNKTYISVDQLHAMEL